MTGRIVFILLFVFFISCRHKGGKAVTEIDVKPIADTTNENFFPVTNYLKGQISEIQKSGVNPLKYTIKNNTTDSAWIKMENVEKEMAPFLEPVIDTGNMKGLYAEKKFLDQTINAYTFTYDPKGQLEDSLPLLHWDVYVDPVSGFVRRIYMLKRGAEDKTVQLTWQSSKWCKMVTIAPDSNGRAAVEKEVLIKWDF